MIKYCDTPSGRVAYSAMGSGPPLLFDAGWVSHVRLVLYGMCADGSDLAPAEVRESVVALMRAHWGLGSKMLAGIFVPDPTAEEVDALTSAQRAAPDRP